MGLSEGRRGEAAGEGDRERLHQRRVAVQTLALDAAVSEIFTFLRERSLHPMLIKGPGTANWLYDSLEERPYGDVDLLVAPDEFDRSKAALAELGFTPAEISAAHHDDLVRGTIAVELHRTLYILSVPEARVWEVLSAGSQTIDVAGVDVTVPSVPVAALIVVLHAIQHGRRKTTPMRDLERALERVDLVTWRSAAQLALRLEAGPVFTAGLRLTPQGAQLADRLQLAEVPVSRFVHLRSMTPPEVAGGIERFATISRPGARLAFLARELVPSPAFMRVWKPIARRGPWGLACAYAWRPFWLVAKLPVGIRAWRTANRQAGRTG